MNVQFVHTQNILGLNVGSFVVTAARPSPLAIRKYAKSDNDVNTDSFNRTGRWPIVFIIKNKCWNDKLTS